jgi:hypothetical protein
MKEYKTLKLDDEEIQVVKKILIEKRVEYLVERSNDKEQVEKDYKLHRENIICNKLLNIIEYLER